jgi:hypothetical protein
MKTLAVAILCLASIALADDLKTINGTEYKHVTVNRVEPDGIVITHSAGVGKIPFTELPTDVQKRFGYDPVKMEAQITAAKAAEEKHIEEQKAAGRERAEKEKNAEADLKRAVEQFQAAEQRAAQSYQGATEGNLSGQVFVSTRGGENHKLGSVQVALFARDAIDILLAGLKIYADIKIQELSPSVDAAKAASDQAEAAERAALGNRQWDQVFDAERRARAEFQKIRDERDFYYSGSFLF